jgi:curli biogenesis system outer membrane secretion channel CsgG
MKRYIGVLVAILVVFVLVGCDKIHGLDDFKISVANRTDHRLLIYANGEPQGEMAANTSQDFKVKLKVIDNRSYYTSPSSTAQVTVNAKDLVTTKLSRSVTFIVPEDRVVNVEFKPSNW